MNIKNDKPITGLPKYYRLMLILICAITVDPLNLLVVSGFDPVGFINSHHRLFPNAVLYYVKSSSFPNTTSLFWLITPVLSLFSCLMWLWRGHITYYSTYLTRRHLVFKKIDQNALIIGLIIMIASGFWGTFFNTSNPKILGAFNPNNSKIALLLFHGGVLAVVIPIFTTFLTLELRAIFNKEKI